jgi:hypothetical protein
MMLQMSEDKLLPGLRLLSGTAASLLLTACILQLAAGPHVSYLQTLLLIYMSLAACIVLASDLTPSYVFERYVVQGLLPWMGMRYGKAILLLICGTYCFD